MQWVQFEGSSLWFNLDRIDVIDEKEGVVKIGGEKYEFGKDEIQSLLEHINALTS